MQIIKLAGNLQSGGSAGSHNIVILYHGNLEHVGDLGCIRNWWAIISALFARIAMEQPMIVHAGVVTTELST